MVVPGSNESAAKGFREWARMMLAHRRGAGGVGPDADRTVYQTSTIGALLDGVYDGNVTIAELLRHGDFGLGTFNRLDGEMLVLDGVCYHLRADGSASIADPKELTPFAAVTRFHPDRTIAVPALRDREDVAALIDRSLPSKNLIYAVRITGQFGMIRTRTVIEQHRPYPGLVEATRRQQEKAFTNATGTLAGFRMPDYEQGISVAGYHLHYIDNPRRHGGHVLDYRVVKATVEISTCSDLHLSLPRTREFLRAELNHTDLDKQIRRSEGG